MQSKPKSNSILTHRRLEDGRLEFTVLGAGSVVFDRTKASAANRDRAEDHGWIQRHADAAAIPRDKETGASATPEMKLARVRAIRDFYEGGGVEWNMKAGPRVVVAKGPDVGKIIMAMIRAGLVPDVDTANGKLAALAEKRGITREAAAELFERTPQVIDALAAMAKEAVSVSVDDLMGDETDDTPTDADQTSDEAPF